MVKVFTQNKNGKIEFAKDELEKLLNEVWWDGRNTNNYYWTSPSSPNWYSTITTNSGSLVNGYNGATGVTVTLEKQEETK